MSEENKAVYVVKTAFEHEGLAYAEGEKYELTDAVVSAMPAGSVEVFAPEAPAPTGDAAATEEKPAAVPAKPWVGGHTVGQE